ncbi:exonuclease phage-type/recb c-terminal [Holotrichia oblita]|uniref:Exonuclease phage-type/recb c-terminal n=1 Tax=Holotrichia oblita TaxID=644536 RepID=A0ACB9SKM6_HOLOL|nr:exonuclease phage-type/recb c-terminal [Holotrichia oblita]
MVDTICDSDFQTGPTDNNNNSENIELAGTGSIPAYSTKLKENSAKAWNLKSKKPKSLCVNKIEATEKITCLSEKKMELIALQIEIAKTHKKIKEVALKGAVLQLKEAEKVTPAEIEQISAATIGQFNNQRYMSERSFRVTASNFGSVVKRRSNTACYNLVKKVLHGDIVQSEAVTYDKIKESVAVNRFEKELGKNVQPAGLYIDSDHIVEVTCLYKSPNPG